MIFSNLIFLYLASCLRSTWNSAFSRSVSKYLIATSLEQFLIEATLRHPPGGPVGRLPYRPVHRTEATLAQQLTSDYLLKPRHQQLWKQDQVPDWVTRDLGSGLELKCEEQRCQLAQKKWSKTVRILGECKKLSSTVGALVNKLVGNIETS